MHALVVDAHLRNAVAGLRALGCASVTTVAAAPHRAGAGLWSSYADDLVRAADGRLGPAIARVAERHGQVAVYPGQEATIDGLLGLRAGLPAGVVLPYPEGDSLPRLRDKTALPSLAAEHGLRAPETLLEGTAAELADAEPLLPFVVKPAAPGALGSARVVESPAQLAELVAELPAGERLLAQERVPGLPSSLALVVDRDGQVAARFQERVLRTWPRDAGSFAVTVSVVPNDELVRRVAAMLTGAGYWGLAQLDLLHDADGALVVDVNPRFYACMPLALHCGVNLPAAWHAVVEGERAGPVGGYPAGRRFRWLEGDLYAARHGQVRGLLRPGPRADAGAVWAADDPVASALLAADSITLPLRRRARGPAVGR